MTVPEAQQPDAQQPDALCSADELRRLFLFEKLTEDQLGWLCREGRVVELTKPGTLDPDPAATAAVAAFRHAHGLVVLTCGTFGNVLRFVPPLVIGEDLLEEGLDILEDAFAAL